MLSLQRIFGKYKGFLRRIRGVYIFNNWLNRHRLQHNKALYRKFKVEKNIYDSVSSADFDHLTTSVEDIPWIDRPDALQKIQQHDFFRQLSPDLQQKILHFISEGYMILEGFYDANTIDAANQEVERLLHDKVADFNYTGRKIMDAHELSPLLNNTFFRNKQLSLLLEFLLGKTIIPFHTINFIYGSEQRAHSDSIHMSTAPQGYLIAAWTAFDDCDENNGALRFYPKSHRLPYITCRDYNSGNTPLLLGKLSYENYEDKVEEVIREHGFQEQYFFAKKGDVLIWHANLIHGGSAIRNKNATRRSMVAHYFAEEVICYHEISQRPALMHVEKNKAKI